MKVNFILPGVGLTGGNRVVFEYANRLTKRGHRINIIYPTIPSRMSEKWTAPKPRIRQVSKTLSRSFTSNEVDWFELNVPVQQIPTLSPNFIKYFEHGIPDADVTIATAWQTAYTVSALDDSKGEKVHFVQHYEIWDTWNSDEAWSQVSSIAEDPSSYPIKMYEVTPVDSKAKRQKELVDRAYELPLTKITISSWLKKLLELKFNQTVAGVVTNSVNHSVFYPEDTIESQVISLLIPSRNIPWKGEREVKKLIKEIRTSYDVEIHLYGNNLEEGDYIDGTIQHSNISDQELRHLYSKADIFVLPSWVEGCQLPPLEAMACKCAVVATNVGGVPDYAEDGETASIVPPRKSGALIEAVGELIEDDEKRAHLQQQGYESVKDYTWENATAQFEQAIQDCS
ncbi:glycosyltransferase family 4 protein [Haloarcula sp. 1CSR25-25]|uniref:glycosyltransferase family 4 protein n=1 Tax=Haloarcula sp. 1CSR25-25 TaxID=2862545 RepID=UPI002895FDD6|nr:glycosyltransferase family 4 protein [Haloarcula sp. 1CSR25-25]MDT3435559.1 glycosyltransferase family 4 protein [Haloarcula sp. 1CSR25-25]